MRTSGKLTDTDEIHIPKAPIFDSAERSDSTPGRHGESTFAFLNRISGDYWSHPRQLVQTWADHIADVEDYRDLRQRFRSRDDEQFRSAFLELYVHECLVRAGYSVTVHPTIPGTSRRPDFYAERAGAGLYVEAIAPGTSPAAKASAGRRAVLFDVVDQVSDPNFFLHLSQLSEGPNPPAAARLRADLRRWLAGLDPDSYPTFDLMPEWHWRDRGWSAIFKAIPKRPDSRGSRPTDRAIGVYGHHEASVVNDAPTIRNALATKHRAYGELDAPFIVAVGTFIFDSDRWHATNAFYGHQAIQLQEAPDGVTVAQVVRGLDGYFGGPPGWKNRNVSAVLLVNQLMPYHVHRAETTLWRHPDPLRPLVSALGLPWTTVGFDGRQLIETAAPVTAADLFGLPDPWPPGDPWPRSTVQY